MSVAPATPTDYEFDLFISYRRVPGWKSTVELMRDIIEEHLNALIGDRLGDDVRIFKDDETIEGGDAWQRRIVNGLARSKVLVPIVWNQYFQRKSTWCRHEYALMRARQETLRTQAGDLPRIIVPIAVYDPITKWRLDPLQCEDVSQHVIAGMTAQSALRDQLWTALGDVAKPIGATILEPPSFDPGWADLSPIDLQGIFDAITPPQTEIVGLAS